MAEKGDVGLVAESSRSTQRLVLPPPALTAGGVFAKFRDIAQLAGSAVSGWAAGPLQTLSSPSPPGDLEGSGSTAQGGVTSVLLLGSELLSSCCSQDCGTLLLRP